MNNEQKLSAVNIPQLIWNPRKLLTNGEMSELQATAEVKWMEGRLSSKRKMSWWNYFEETF